MKEINNLNYYPFDRLALVVSKEDLVIQELVLLTSRWGVYSLKGSNWVMTVPNHFRYQDNLYAHLDTDSYQQIIRRFNSLSPNSTLSTLEEFQVTYDFENHIFYDCLFQNNLRDAYEIARWVNEFTLPSREEIEPSIVRGSDEYHHFVREVEDLENARREYEEEILSRRNKVAEAKKIEPLTLIEGFPPVNKYLEDLFLIAHDRNFMLEIGTGYENDWDIDSRISTIKTYLSGKVTASIQELDSIANYLKERIYRDISPLSAEAISYIAEIQDGNSGAKYQPSFQQLFLGTTGFIPQSIAAEFLRSGLSPSDLSKAISQTKIVSIRVLEEAEPGNLKVYHLVCPIETFDSNSEYCETGSVSFAYWKTIENDRNDVSYRVSIIFQDAIDLSIHRKELFLCGSCKEHLEECENISNNDSETWEVIESDLSQSVWWPEWWEDYDGPRLTMDGIHAEAIEMFANFISGEIANSLSRSGFDSMLEAGETFVWQAVGSLWDEVARVVSTGKVTE
jgi:hypothetical protein